MTTSGKLAETADVIEIRPNWLPRLKAATPMLSATADMDAIIKDFPPGTTTVPPRAQNPRKMAMTATNSTAREPY